MSIKAIVLREKHKFIEFVRFIKLDYKYKSGVRYVNNKNTIKRRLAFLIDFPQSWSAIESIYEEAINTENLEVYIIAIPQLSPGAKETNIAGLANAAFDFFTELGIDVIKANQADNTWFQLTELNLDYIVYTRPYNEYYPTCYKSFLLCNHSKIFYVPYAYGMLGDKMLSLVLPDHFVLSAHRVYFANESRMTAYIKGLVWYRKALAKRMKYIGFPRFDQLGRRCNNLPENDKFVVAWMPRWAASDTNSDQKTSHFLVFYKALIEYFAANPDMQLIIRPHPKMFSSYIAENIMTKEEVSEFKEICKRENIVLDEAKDCFDTIGKADALIADYTSLIAEYFMTGKPIIFCDTVDGLNDEGQKMCGSSYYADDFESIIRYLDMLKAGKDENISKRKEVISDLLPGKTGEIGKNILESIMNS